MLQCYNRVITETWLQSDNTTSVSAITPRGYLFEHVARSNQRGGGVGVLFRASFTLDHSKLWPASSFECIDIQLRCNAIPSTLRLFVIYRPPSSSPNSQPFATFLTEFRHLVECVGTKSGIIILGDFNIPYGNADDAHARALRDILSDANMRQNVTGGGLGGFRLGSRPPPGARQGLARLSCCTPLFLSLQISYSGPTRGVRRPCRKHPGQQFWLALGQPSGMHMRQGATRS